MQQSRIALTAVALVLLISCQSSGPAPQQDRPSGDVASAVTYEGGQGTGCDDLVVIKGATNEDDGIKAEYQWIATKFPGYQRGGQGLGNCPGKITDVIDITTSTGEKRRIYFDITAFFGKW